MTEQSLVYQATVREVRRTGGWIILHTTQEKPLAFNEAIFKGKLPVKGDRISVEANEGKYWCFGEHRSMVITKGGEFYRPPDLDTGFYERLSQPILEMLRT